MSTCGCQCCSLEILTLRTRLEIANRDLKEKAEIIENLTDTNLNLKLELYQLHDRVNRSQNKSDAESKATKTATCSAVVKEEKSEGTAAVVDTSAMGPLLLTQGYQYDEKSQNYYNPETGYYYLPANNLYYNVFTKQYFCYDTDSNSYVLWERDTTDQNDQSQGGLENPTAEQSFTSGYYKKQAEKYKLPTDGSVDTGAFELLVDLCDQVDQLSVTEKPTRKRKLKKEEIGELSNAEVKPVLRFDDIEAYCTTYEEHALVVAARKRDIAAEYPPCIRVMVLESDCLGKGTLNSVITHVHSCQIGRETSDITIRSESVSRKHAKVFYDPEKKSYFIEDLGSRNGTRVNEQRIAKTVAQLDHLAKVTVGQTVFELHIHEGMDTCDGCEPGLQRKVESPTADAISISSLDKEAVRRHELKALKKKFGLQNSAHENSPGLAANYTDRSHRRRVVKGSDNPYQKDTPAASVDSHIPAENKGFKMLSKLGWKGESLGKSNTGIMEPVNPVATLGRSGVGSEAVATIAESPAALQKKERWMKAQIRYDRIENPNASQPVEIPQAESGKKSSKAWVAGGLHIG